MKPDVDNIKRQRHFCVTSNKKDWAVKHATQNEQ